MVRRSSRYSLGGKGDSSKPSKDSGSLAVLPREASQVKPGTPVTIVRRGGGGGGGLVSASNVDGDLQAKAAAEAERVAKEQARKTAEAEQIKKAEQKKQFESEAFKEIQRRREQERLFQIREGTRTDIRPPTMEEQRRIEERKAKTEKAIRSLQVPEQKIRKGVQFLDERPGFDFVLKKQGTFNLLPGLGLRSTEIIKESIGLTSEVDARKVVGGGTVIDTASFFTPFISTPRQAIFTSAVASKTTLGGTKYIAEQPLEFGAGLLGAASLGLKAVRGVKTLKRAQDIKKAQTSFLAEVTPGDKTQQIKSISVTKIGKKNIGGVSKTKALDVGDDLFITGGKGITVTPKGADTRLTEQSILGVSKRFKEGKVILSKVATTPTKTKVLAGKLELPGKVKNVPRQITTTKTLGVVGKTKDPSVFTYRGLTTKSKIFNVKGLIKVVGPSDEVSGAGKTIITPPITKTTEKLIGIEATKQFSQAISSVPKVGIPRLPIVGGTITEIKKESKVTQQPTTTSGPSLQKEEIKVSTTTITATSPKVTTKTRQGTRGKTIQRVETTPRVIPITETGILQTPATRKSPRIKSKARSRNILTPVVIPLVNQPNDNTIPLGLLKGTPKKKKGRQTFGVSVRRFGKFKSVGLGTTGLARGEQLTRDTLAATFKVTGKNLKGITTPKGFYKKQTGEGLLFIEKRSKRLQRGTKEVPEILRAKRIRL